MDMCNQNNHRVMKAECDKQVLKNSTANLELSIICYSFPM